MSTSLEDIVDRFMMLQNDYQLLTLYKTSIEDFNTYLEGWLIFAADEFAEFCTQDLTYSTTTQTFTETLTQENINILAQLMVKYWLQKQIQNVLQMNNLIQDHDFKTFSQSSNLKAKQDYYAMKVEELSQMLVSYAYRHNNWSDWNSQDFVLQ